MVYSVAECIARIFNVRLLHASLLYAGSDLASYIIGLRAITFISVVYTEA